MTKQLTEQMKSQSFFGSRNLVAWALLCGCSISAQASVRQRLFIEDSKASKTGTESIVHWDFSVPATVKIYNWGGSTLSSSSALTYSDVVPIFGTSFARWTAGFNGLLPNVSLDLNGANPYESSSGCELTTTGSGDNLNTILFSSKLDTSCSQLIPSGSGAIGLTKVHYSASDAIISEVDMQFDDRHFKFTSSGSNDLDTSTINLYNVAVHEMGHFFSLDHADVREAAMIFAVAEDLEHPKSDDFMGLFSLYPPTGASSSLGGLKGSLMSADGTPIFGAVVFLINPRTMSIASSEMTDANGAFEFCAVPAGPYVIYANRYQPYGGNIHDYYSGDAGGGATKTVGSDNVEVCYNPSCTVMNRQIAHSFFTKTSANTAVRGGEVMKLVNVAAGQSQGYVNLTAASSEPSLELVAGTTSTPGSALVLDEPRLARLNASTIALDGGSGSLGSDVYSFTAPTSGSVIIKTSALRLYSRVHLSLALYDASQNPVSCSAYPAYDLALAKDPGLSCTGLTSGAEYRVRVTGTGVSCRQIPGNVYGNISESCEDTSIGEDASTPIPYYLINVFESSLETDTSLADDSYAGTSMAATTWNGLPTCSSFSATISQVEPGGGACCGTLSHRGPRPPNGPKSFWFSFLTSPGLWFGLLWTLRELSRMLKSARLRLQHRKNGT